MGVPEAGIVCSSWVCFRAAVGVLCVDRVGNILGQSHAILAVCAAGLQDANTVEKAVTPAGPDTVAFVDNAETGTPLWTVAGSGAGSNFALTTNQALSPTQSWFVTAPSTTSSHALSMASPVAIPNAAGTTLEFFHCYNTENNYDGGILEYSLDGTNWTDILAAQGVVPANTNRFVSGGYNGTMAAGGAFGARAAWHGAFNTTWLRTAVNLADFNGGSATLADPIFINGFDSLVP